MQIMDSWIFGGAERVSFGLCDGNFQPFDSPSLTKEVTSSWGTSNSNLEHSAMGTGQSIVDNPTIVGSSFQGVQKAVFEGSVREFAENRVNDHLATSCSSLMSKTSVGEKEEGSKESSSIVDPDAHDSSFIDLKLGRLSEWRGFEESESPRDMQNLSVQASPAPGKRTRLSGLSGKMPLCQVHGCNMDLSSFKDYYKRHRVCQTHSKTAKVIVNGIQQRFCQQCSRFHLLSEFDEGKRSCRKRLAGHNERRRKPQIVFQTGKSNLMLPYHGGNFLGSTLSGKTSFLCQNGISQHGNYESVNWSRFNSLDNSLTSMQMPTSDFDGHPKSFAACGTEKEISFSNGDVSLPGSMYNSYATRFSSGISILDAGRAEKARVGVSNSGCARSLLSSQPICSSSLSIPEAQPAMFTSNNYLKTKPQLPFSFPDKSELALQASSDFTCSLGVDEPVCGQAGLLPCEIKGSHRMEAQTYINFRGSPFDGNDFPLPNGQDHTANLLQLSSIIQDAESHSRSLQVKQELGHLPPFQCYR